MAVYGTTSTPTNTFANNKKVKLVAANVADGRVFTKASVSKMSQSEFSGKKLEYQDPETNEKYIPNVIEYSIGADRLTLAILCNSYEKEELENEAREVMHFHPAIAPYKVAILPLVKKYHKDKAEELFKMFSKNFMSTYDETGSIGKRYRRQDVIGTPYCITVDDETLNNGTVTVRDRDTMEQVTLSVEDAIKYVEDKIKF